MNAQDVPSSPCTPAARGTSPPLQRCPHSPPQTTYHLFLLTFQLVALVISYCGFDKIFLIWTFVCLFVSHIYTIQDNPELK